MSRFLPAVLSMAGSLVLLSAAPAPKPIAQFCTGCHNGKAKAAGLALDAIAGEDVARHPAEWEKVIRRLRARSMPPGGLPRPNEAAYRSMVETLEASLDAAPADPGRTDTFRRLNRTEYRNAIRDLLALDVNIASLLPADESSHGFDNITVGELSPTLLERYLGAARVIGRLALGVSPKTAGGDTITLPPDLTQEDHFDELPLGTRGGTVVRYTFPVEAVYEFQLRLARDRNEHVEGLYRQTEVELMLDGERVKLFTVSPVPTGQDHSRVDTHLNIRIPVRAGPHVVAATFPKLPSMLLETERQPYMAHFNMDRHPRITPAIYSVTVNGPYEAKGPGETPSRQRLLVCRPASPAEEDPCARQILSTLMRRAFRRPVNAADLTAPLRFYRQARAAKESFESGIEMALRAVLVSPEFLFRIERDPAGTAPGAAYRLNDLELASRLSFFLWSSIPDDELLDLASAGKLSAPATLEKQTRRMLADSRAGALATNFAEQWLYLRNLAASTPDMRAFADFDDNLRQAFRRETELFFTAIQREDRSILELINANWTFVNERLAKHYGIPNVYGGRFRRVEFPAGSPENARRGGLLRHGSILTVTSYATRTSPVIRGKWILDNLLGVPPPPPPGNVPALKEKASLQALSIRERLAEHRDNPACSGCHQLMDPVGFSLENYDAVGRWRVHDDWQPVDAAGGFPDGSKFDGVAGLEKAILARPDLFSTRLTEKLLTYGLGRGVEAGDGPAVRSVVRGAEAGGYRFSSFILGIVRSTPFQMRRSSRT